MEAVALKLGQRIEDRSAKVGVVGLGYVGLPVACVFAEAGYRVVGIRRDAEKVALVNRGISPIEGDEPGLDELLREVVASGRLTATTDFAVCSDLDVILVAVETPVDGVTKQPDYSSLRAALSSIGDNLGRDTLIVIESTIAPGTMASVVRPILEQRSGLSAGKDFWLVNCPERVMPGKLLNNLRRCSRVVGADSEEVAAMARAFYRMVVQTDVDIADCVTAEIVKTAENAYRDVQIAFANEMALLCESVGADVWRVRDLVNKSPFRDMHLPGAGVGGHCIPKDPWLLISGAGEGFESRLISTARSVNDGMPFHVAELALKALALQGRDPREARVVVLGYAYLENSDDTRNSPSEVLVKYLADRGVPAVVHDPYVDGYKLSLEDALRQADCAIIMVAHDCYRKIDMDSLASLMRSPIVIDGRRVLDPSRARRAGLHYVAIGDGSISR